MPRHEGVTAGKYLGFMAIAFRADRANRGAVIGRLGFYFILLLVFSRLWAVAETHPLVRGTSASDLLWYLTLTEWVVLSLPLVHLKIEEDVRTGNLAYWLARPISYPLMRYAEAVGILHFRLMVLGIGAFFIAWGLSGSLPSHPWGLLLAIPLVWMACLVSLLYGIVIGLTAFWIEDSTPVGWVWQKASFLLGGLILPMSLYPKWLARLADLTPFPALLYRPATAALTDSPSAAAISAMLILFWGAVGAGLLAFVFRRGMRIVTVGGG